MPLLPLRSTFVVFFNNVHNIISSYKAILQLFESLLFPSLLVMQIWGIKQLWGKNGSCGFYSLHNIPKELLAVVIDKSNCSSTVTQSPRSSNLKKHKFILS